MNWGLSCRDPINIFKGMRHEQTLDLRNPQWHGQYPWCINTCTSQEEGQKQGFGPWVTRRILKLLQMGLTTPIGLGSE